MNYCSCPALHKVDETKWLEGRWIFLSWNQKRKHFARPRSKGSCSGSTHSYLFIFIWFYFSIFNWKWQGLTQHSTHTWNGCLFFLSSAPLMYFQLHSVSRPRRQQQHCRLFFCDLPRLLKGQFSILAAVITHMSWETPVKNQRLWFLRSVAVYNLPLLPKKLRHPTAAAFTVTTISGKVIFQLASGGLDANWQFVTQSVDTILHLGCRLHVKRLWHCRGPRTRTCTSAESWPLVPVQPFSSCSQQLSGLVY